MNFASAFAAYDARYVTEADIPSVLSLFKDNPLYFEHCPPPPSEATIREAIAARPTGLDKDCKHFVGIWAHASLIAVLDLLEGFPEDSTVWLGLFMVAEQAQGHGLGTDLIGMLCSYYEGRGFLSVQLGYVKENPQAAYFWRKNGFYITGRESVEKHRTIIIAEKPLG